DDDRDERCEQTADRHDELHEIAPGAGSERLDEHTDDGRAEDDEHRQRQAVLDRGRRNARGGDHLLVPSAAGTGCVGFGSVTPTWCMVRVTAGEITSSTGFGKKPRTSRIAITGATTHASRFCMSGVRSTNAPSGRGPV